MLLCCSKQDNAYPEEPQLSKHWFGNTQKLLNYVFHPSNIYKLSTMQVWDKTIK